VGATHAGGGRCSISSRASRGESWISCATSFGGSAPDRIPVVRRRPWSRIAKAFIPPFWQRKWQHASPLSGGSECQEIPAVEVSRQRQHRSTGPTQRQSPMRFAAEESCPRCGHFVKYSLRVAEIGRVETLGVRAVQVADHSPRFVRTVVTRQKPTEAGDGSHLP